MDLSIHVSQHHSIPYGIVQSLDTQSCLDAVRRFIVRKGKPKTLISDNGTNFVGAANELKAAFKELNHSKMQQKLTQNGIQWTFVPPAAPHFGGAWESLVKSSEILGKESLKEENLSTVICIAEQLLNNRPSTAISSDVEDLDTIRPNHFLVGGANVSWPISLFSNNNAPNFRLNGSLSIFFKKHLDFSVTLILQKLTKTRKTT